MTKVQKKIEELFDELEKKDPDGSFKHETFYRFNKNKKQYWRIEVIYRRKRQELPKK